MSGIEPNQVRSREMQLKLRLTLCIFAAAAVSEFVTLTVIYKISKVSAHQACFTLINRTEIQDLTETTKSKLGYFVAAWRCLHVSAVSYCYNASFVPQTPAGG